jgi:DNA-binding MarR family transcriptional regulator
MESRLLYDGALASARLSQFRGRVAVANREKPEPAELTKLPQNDESTFGGNDERIYARGWLRLERDEDRRSRLIEVTDEGHALIRRYLPS